MKKIFTKKNLKKALKYTAVAIGGAVIATVGLAYYGNSMSNKEMLESEEFELDVLSDNEDQEIMDTEETGA